MLPFHRTGSVLINENIDNLSFGGRADDVGTTYIFAGK